MRGICFKENMFYAVIGGTKTVTRRLSNRYNVGEILYLKEPYFVRDDGVVEYKFNFHISDRKWKNKLFMPSKYARYFIKITDAEWMHLKDISFDDCLREGVTFQTYAIVKNCSNPSYVSFSNGLTSNRFSSAREAFAELIDLIDGKGTWNSDPIVMRYEFKLINQ